MILSVTKGTFILSFVCLIGVIYASTIGRIVCKNEHPVCQSLIPDLNSILRNRPSPMISLSKLTALFRSRSSKVNRIEIDYQFPRIVIITVIDEIPIVKIISNIDGSSVVASDRAIIDQGQEYQDLIEASTNQTLPPIGSQTNTSSIKSIVDLIKLFDHYQLVAKKYTQTDHLIEVDLGIVVAKFFDLKDLHIQAARLQHILSHTTIESEVLIDLQYDQPIMISL